MKLKSSKIIYLPLETKVRELDAKLLLATYAISRGYKVIFGYHTVLGTKKLKESPPGAVLFKHLGGKGLKKVKDAGHSILVLDAEGLVFRPEEFLAARIREGSPYVDKYFCWGDYQYDVVKESPKIKESQMVVTGNPRLDLLQNDIRPFFQEAADTIRQKYPEGPLILVNSNFSSVNNSFGESFYEKFARTTAYGKEGFDDEYVREYLENQRQCFLAFKRAIKSLSEEFSNSSIIVRPHPSENINHWENFTAEFNNVEVQFQGNVHEWIYASDLVVNFQCTTAIESVLMDTPSISYWPIRNKKFDYDVFMHFGVQVGAEEELLHQAEKLLKGEHTGKFTDDKKQKKYIYNLENIKACRKILDEIDSLSLPQVKYSPESVHYESRYFYAKFARACKQFIKWVFWKFVPFPLLKRLIGEERAYACQDPTFFSNKRPILNKKEIEQKLNKLVDLEEVPADQFELTPLQTNLFMVEDKNS